MPAKQVYLSYDRKKCVTVDEFKFCPCCTTSLIIETVERVPRQTCPKCGFIRYKNPFPTVSLLIVQGARVLLGTRRGEPGKGKWATPSGYIDYEDDFLSTALREAREETGLEVEIKAILNVTSSFLSPRYHFLNVYLLAEVVGGNLVAGDDLKEVKWFPIAGPFPELAFQEDIDILAAYNHKRFKVIDIAQMARRITAR